MSYCDLNITCKTSHHSRCPASERMYPGCCLKSVIFIWSVEPGQARPGLISHQNYILHTLPPGLPCQPGYRGWSGPSQTGGAAPIRMDQIITSQTRDQVRLTTTHHRETLENLSSPVHHQRISQSDSASCLLFCLNSRLTSHLYRLNSLAFVQLHNWTGQLSSDHPAIFSGRGLSRAGNMAGQYGISFHKYGPMMR